MIIVWSFGSKNFKRRFILKNMGWCSVYEINGSLNTIPPILNRNVRLKK